MNELNKKLLEFYMATPYTWEILYKFNNINYCFEEHYLSSWIRFFIDKEEYDHIDIDGKCFMYKANKYMFNLYLSLRSFVVYETEGK